MSIELMESVGSLVVVRCWCGIQHAVPKSLRETQLKAHDKGQNHAIFCPLGHKYCRGWTNKKGRLSRRIDYWLANDHGMIKLVPNSKPQNASGGLRRPQRRESRTASAKASAPAATATSPT